MANDDEVFPALQYSKGFGRCSKCQLVRPFKHLLRVEGVRVCRDTVDCERMKALKEEDDAGEAEVGRHQAERALPDPKPEERVKSPTFWNSADPTLV